MRGAVENSSRSRALITAARTASPPLLPGAGKMKIAISLLLSLMTTAGAEESSEEGKLVQTLQTDDTYSALANTDLVLAFVVFRHGDRTPDQEELDLMPSAKLNLTEILFPYGMKALTNKGKQRGYYIGMYLRSRYHGFISNLYLPDEIEVRTTDYARTKMTALTLLAALYYPPPAQRWHDSINWQPVPYNTLPKEEDDLLYWYICPRYLWLRNKVYQEREVKLRIQSEQGIFAELSRRTGANITTPEDVFYLDNLFQALENVGYPPPTWAQPLMPYIKAMTKIEYAIESYNVEMIRLSAGVLLTEILNATSSAVRGEVVQPKLRLYSGHENNVASLMAATKVFEAHQPRYGATFSLELRLNPHTGQYGIAAVYSPNAGGPAKILPIAGCGGAQICNYEDFVALTQETVLSKEEFNKLCQELN